MLLYNIFNIKNNKATYFKKLTLTKPISDASKKAYIKKNASRI